MINNSTNINKTKESLNSDGQQFYQYQQNKESLNSDDQQFHQYQQNDHLSSQINSLNTYTKITTSNVGNPGPVLGE